MVSFAKWFIFCFFSRYKYFQFQLILDFYTQSVDYIKQVEGKQNVKEISFKDESVQTMRKTVLLLNNQLTNVEDLTETEFEELCDAIFLQEDEASEEMMDENDIDAIQPDLTNDSNSTIGEQTSQAAAMIPSAHQSVAIEPITAGPTGISCVDPHFSLQHRFKLLNVSFS